MWIEQVIIEGTHTEWVGVLMTFLLCDWWKTRRIQTLFCWYCRYVQIHVGKNSHHYRWDGSPIHLQCAVSKTFQQRNFSIMSCLLCSTEYFQQVRTHLTQIPVVYYMCEKTTPDYVQTWFSKTLPWVHIWKQFMFHQWYTPQVDICALFSFT